MTIEEYDKKKELREKIRVFEAFIEGDITRVTTQVGDLIHGHFVWSEDPILIERFKQLLLERKQELINEFEK